jgi:hypothetical protein
MIKIVPDEVAPATNWGWVVGMHGAGVSLAEEVLNAHTDVRLLRQGFVTGYLGVFQRPTVEVDPFWAVDNRIITQEYQVRGGGWNASFLREVFEAMRRQFAPGGIPMMMEGACWLAHHMDDVQTVFPGSRIVWVLRDPWETVMTATRHKLQGAEPSVEDLEKQVAIVGQQATAYRHHVERFGDLVTTLWFEQLTADFVAQGTALLAGIGMNTDYVVLSQDVIAPRPEQMQSRVGPWASALADVRDRIRQDDLFGLPWISTSTWDDFFATFPDEGQGW